MREACGSVCCWKRRDCTSTPRAGFPWRGTDGNRGGRDAPSRPGPAPAPPNASAQAADARRGALMERPASVLLADSRLSQLRNGLRWNRHHVVALGAHIDEHIGDTQARARQTHGAIFEPRTHDFMTALAFVRGIVAGVPGELHTDLFI